MNKLDKTYDIPLHDIKPLIEIQEYSLYYFIAIVTVISLLILGALYLLYRYFRNRNKYNKRKAHFALLEALDLSDTKQTAYDLTAYGATFKNDTPRHLKHFDLMVEKLQKYKYKKSVETFDADTLRQIEIYKGMLDV
ncbi:hypothetical protein [Sulfurimonas sp. C5]|uniref:hypothetical protein n=1 Tax=Sulfurimonas sp. C5 TaxID=3036947 RepID=UPI00245752D8|nr:hypothetical protein [Sulfurimonas sp. C5]MDH4945371.1 hypothetical protein [Sulfurimonas sp. C5]